MGFYLSVGGAIKCSTIRDLPISFERAKGCEGAQASPTGSLNSQSVIIVVIMICIMVCMYLRWLVDCHTAL